MARISLDVGCGANPKGTVNVDFFREGFNPQTGDQRIGHYMKARNIENFVIGDAMHLPFKENAFDVVFSVHAIEHVTNPSGMLREMSRVAKGKVIVRCPHRRGSNAVKPFHINFLDENWFQKRASAFGLNMQYTFEYEYPIFRALSKIIPDKLKRKLKRSLK